MAFYGCEFSFDGIPCSEYGLMVYTFGSTGQSDVSFETGDVAEDRLSSRYDALMYGLNQNQSLSYTLVFGPNIESLDANQPLDRYEVEAIAAWLVGHQQRKWLTIVQPDMEAFRYKCLISGLKLVTYGDMPWAFSCTVSCDSPFAYTFPDVFSYSMNGSSRGIDVNLFNRSSYNGYYAPVIEIEPTGTSVSIVNHSDGDREFKLEGLPTGESFLISVDNKNQVITSSHSIDKNMYSKFNMNFFRLVRGDNMLTIKGSGKIRFVCEFPVNIGG